MNPTTAPQTGDILMRSVDENGTPYIIAAVNLPTKAWEQITRWVNEVARSLGDDRPDIPLDEGISEFLNLQAQMGLYDVRRSLGEPQADDLNDGMPF